MPLSQDNRDLQFSGSQDLGESPVLIRSIQLSEQLGRPFHAELELVSEDFNIDFSQVVGQNITICYAGGAAPRYLNGFVSRFAQNTPRNRLASYSATVVPFLWYLTRNADCRIFQNQSIPDIVKQVLQDRGFTDVVDQLNDTYSVWDYCVQYRETDFNFISRLLEQEGIYYFFQHENGKHNLVLVDDPAGHEPIPMYESISFRPTAGDAVGEYIHEWTFEQEVQPASCALSDYDFTAPRKSLLSASQAQQDTAGDNLEIFDYPGEYNTPADGSQYAKVRIQELAWQFATAHGSGDAAGVSTGSTFTLTDFPRDDQNREYLITASSFHVSSDVGDAGGSSEEIPVATCHFSVIDAQIPFRTPRVTPKPIVQGPQTAVVVGPAGQEIYTDEHGRVKVQFFWDRYGTSDENSSCWIRVAQVWAGKKWGGMFIPRIGQEVIVEFLEGDPDQPIITGRVYNGANTPPYTLPAHATMSTLKSNSSPGAGGDNEIRFEDKKGAEQVMIRSQRRTDFYTGDAMYLKTGGNFETHVGGSTDSGETAGNSVTWVGGETHSHQNKKVFEKVDQDVSRIYVAPVSEGYQQDRSVNIQGKETLNADSMLVSVENGVTLKASSLAVECSGTLSLKGGTVAIEGSTGGVSISVGGNFVAITTAGVAINGTMVQINSGGSATAAGSAEKAGELNLPGPLEAAIAHTGAPGTASKTHAGTTRKQQIFTFKAKNAPDWVPPPPTPGPKVPRKKRPEGCEDPVLDDDPPDDKPKPLVCGGPYNMTDPEQGGDRKANEDFVLQVVPASLLGGDVIFIKSTGGCSCAGAQISVGGNISSLNAPIKISGWSAGLDLWDLVTFLAGATPKIMAVQLTCLGPPGSALPSGEIHVYPSDKVELTVELKEILEKWAKVASMMRGLASVLSKITGKTVDPLKGIKFQAGLGLVIVSPPTLSIGYEAQWKEFPAGNAEEEWQVFYGYSFKLALTLAIEFKLDVLLAAATCTGVGAPIVKLANKVKEALGQEEPLIFFGIKAEVSGTGAIGHEESAFGSLEIRGTGTVSIGAMISVHDVIEASVEASTAVHSSLLGKASAKGPEVGYEFLKWDGVWGKAHVKLDVGLFAVGLERSVPIIVEAGPLLQGSLLP